MKRTNIYLITSVRSIAYFTGATHPMPLQLSRRSSFASTLFFDLFAIMRKVEYKIYSGHCSAAQVNYVLVPWPMDDSGDRLAGPCRPHLLLHRPTKRALPWSYEDGPPKFAKTSSSLMRSDAATDVVIRFGVRIACMFLQHPKRMVFLVFLPPSFIFLFSLCTVWPRGVQVR